MIKSLIVATIFFCIWIYVGFSVALLNSPTFDEPVHAKAATLYFQGTYDFDPIEPPLVRISVAQLSTFSHLSDRNIVTIITGLLASGLVFYLGTQSIYSAYFAAILLLSEPNLIAHSSLFTTDAISAFLTAISTLFILKNFWDKPWRLAITTIFISLAIASKISTLSLLAPLLLIKSPSIGFRRLSTIILSSCFLIWFTYGFRFDLPFKSFPFVIPLGSYFRSLKENLQFAHRGQPLFFFEHLYITGPVYKQLVVFLLKTPLLQLCLLVFSGQYLLPLLLILLVNTTVGLHFGIRHLLTASVLVILSASQLKIKRTSLKLLLLLLAVIQLSTVYTSLPQFITYTNPLAGHQSFRIFTDSDFDWGQGLYSLNRTLTQKGIANYQLAYFGNVDPKNYLGTYIRIKDSNPVGSLQINNYDPKLPAIISVTCYYQCGYYSDSRFDIGKSEIIAQSFLLFEPKTND